MASLSTTDQFLKKYGSNDYQEYYTKLAEDVRKLCEDLLNKNGEKRVQANVTCRVKAAERLRDKLKNRQEYQGHLYKSEKEIREDIVDLVGVRIALFFPSDRKEVCEMIGKEFLIEKRVEHPRPGRGETQANEGKDKGLKSDQDDDKTLEYDRKFEGYQATHLWARFYDDRRPPFFKKNDRIEIQVMTVLQSAWSEVQYDILYKHLDGKPSDLESQILDGLNGLVSIGEMYLNDLSTVRKSRVCSDGDREKIFDNEYELGAFLFSKIPEMRRRERFTLSSVELLQKFLGLSCVNANNKDRLGRELSNLRLDAQQGSRQSMRHPKKENISLIIMRNIYSEKRLSDQARKSQPRTSLERCEILISTVVSLHDLFPPTSIWAIELTGSGRGGQELSAAQRGARNNLKWLVSAQAPRNVVLGELKRLKSTENEKIEGLWKWFGEHNSEMIQFAFGISNLGVARDLEEDLETLDQICYIIEGCLLEP